jgi:hypothetical protein
MPIVVKEIAISVSVGDPADARPAGEIHIESFSWGLSQTGAHAASGFDGRLLAAQDLSAEQGAAGKAEPKEFTITKKTDTAAADGVGDAEAAWDEAGAALATPALLPSGDYLF